MQQKAWRQFSGTAFPRNKLQQIANLHTVVVKSNCKSQVALLKFYHPLINELMFFS